MRRHVNEQILSAVAIVTFLASIQTNAKHNSDRLACAAPLRGSPGAVSCRWTLISMRGEMKRIRILACQGLKQRLVVVFWAPKWPQSIKFMWELAPSFWVHALGYKYV